MMSALLKAARQLLRESGSFPKEQCEVQYDGRPMPNNALYYLAVHPGYFRPAFVDASTRYNVGVNVTLSYRTSRIHTDRRGVELFLGEMDAVEPIVVQVIAALNFNYNVPVLADSFLQGKGTFNSGNPLLLQSDLTQYISRDGSWWGGQPDDNVGLSLTMTFGNLLYQQVVPDEL